MKAPATGVFRSLRKFNYRVWIAGAFVSNVGTWVQRTAQDWPVLTQTRDDGTTAWASAWLRSIGNICFQNLPLISTAIIASNRSVTARR